MHIPAKLMALILALILALPTIPAFAETDTVELVDLPIYYFRSSNVGTVPVAFFDGNTDIPYCSVENVAQLLYDLNKKLGDSDYSLTIGYTTYGVLKTEGMLSIGADTDPDDQVFYMIRENGSFVLFDYKDDLIWFNDRDKFYVHSYAVSGGDLVSSDGYYYLDSNTIRWNSSRDEASVNLYKRVNSCTFIREGEVTSIPLATYDISIEMYDGSYYVPLATASDFLLPVPVTFNGEALFATIDGLDNITTNDDGLTQCDLYYLPGARERSEALAFFTYNELCLMLDYNYGLQLEHGITEGFDRYFVDTELINDLCNTDTAVFTNALSRLLLGYFGDRHSGLSYPSPYNGSPSIDVMRANTSISIRESSPLYERFLKARNDANVSVNDQVINGYTEIGDTAFITFDSFKSASQDYYDTDLWSNLSDIYMSDTISLVIYAHRMIHREESPIRKVVIDLSCNGGGALDACVYIAAWVLGSANISIENAITGAQYTTTYWTDVDLDGVCALEDELGVDNLDVYCLVNGNSFSCGNLLPTLFKQDGRVTLIGQTTGGGACIVREAAAADGTLFSVSDLYRLSIVKNGSFYSIDRGVEADIPLRKPASFYDRAALAEYLDTIR